MANWWDKILGRGPKDPAGKDEWAQSDQVLEQRAMAAVQSRYQIANEEQLLASLKKFPGVSIISTGGDDQTWWVMFHLDLKLPLTLDVIRFLAYEFNNTVTGSFPGAFYPKAPNAFLNRDNSAHLNWCIDVWSPEMTTLDVAQKLDELFEEFQLSQLPDSEPN